MKNLWVKRANTSSYFPADFNKQEQTALEAVPGIHYLSSDQEVKGDEKFCLLTNTHTQLSHWKKFKSNIEFILHPNSGFDNFAQDLADWKDIPIVLGNPIRAQAVAEWTLSALFHHFTTLKHHPTWPKSREWNRPLLKDKKILILGFGHIGQIINKSLNGFGVSPTVYDPFQGKEANLSGSWDAVILAASVNPENHGIIGRTFFQHANPELLIVNPARSEFIDESALRDFLKKSPKARCYLDVHPTEPFSDNYWQDCPGIIATPHIAGVSSGLVTQMLQFESEVLSDWIHLSQDHFSKKYNDLLLSSRLTEKGWYR